MALGESLVGHISSNDNIIEKMTKVSYGQKWGYMVSNILHEIYDDCTALDSYHTDQDLKSLVTMVRVSLLRVLETVVILVL